VKQKVQVVDIKFGAVVHSVNCNSERSAERVEQGMSINLNHAEYFTRIVPNEETELTK